jgi:glucose/arabinose dehydrogenase
MRFEAFVLATCLLVVRAAAGLAQSEPDPAAPSQLRAGSGAFGDWRADAPLVRRKITVNDLPKPFATRSTNNPPRIVVKPAGASPKVPPGFQAELFASDLKDPRALIVAPNGDLFVVESEPGRIRVLRASHGEAKPRENRIFASGLDGPLRWLGVTDKTVRQIPANCGEQAAAGSIHWKAAFGGIASMPGGPHSKAVDEASLRRSVPRLHRPGGRSCAPW